MSKIQMCGTARHLARAPSVPEGLWKGQCQQLAQNLSMSRSRQPITTLATQVPPSGAHALLLDSAPNESWLCHLQILVPDLSSLKPPFPQLYNGEDKIYSPRLYWRLRRNACKVLSLVTGTQWALNDVFLSVLWLSWCPLLFQTANSQPLLEQYGVGRAIMSYFTSIHFPNLTTG